MKEIDARGLACPAPVLQTKAAIEEAQTPLIRVIVDNDASRQNVERFLESRNYETLFVREGEDFFVTGKKGEGTLPEETPAEKPAKDLKKIMVLVATNMMGRGDDTLGKKLMVNFIKTLEEMGAELWRLVFVNSGVKLAAEGSEVLPELTAYEKSGLKILVCGTCLTHFDLLDKKEVGETTNMLDIVTAMQLADKVINV